MLYGRTTPPSGTVDLDGTNGTPATGVDPAHGFRIDGAAQTDETGRSVAAGGDVDNDGRDDVVIGARAAGANGRPGSARPSWSTDGHLLDFADDLATSPTYVTSGHQIPRLQRTASRPTSLPPGTRWASRSPARSTVGPAGAATLVLGARYASNLGRTEAGAAYVNLRGPGSGQRRMVNQIDNSDIVANVSQSYLDGDDLVHLYTATFDGDGEANGSGTTPSPRDPTRSSLPRCERPRERLRRGIHLGPMNPCPAGTSAGVTCQVLPGGGRQITGTGGNDTIVAAWGYGRHPLRRGQRCGEGGARQRLGSTAPVGVTASPEATGNDRLLNGGSGNDRLGRGLTGRDRLSGAIWERPGQRRIRKRPPGGRQRTRQPVGWPRQGPPAGRPRPSIG